MTVTMHEAKLARNEVFEACGGATTAAMEKGAALMNAELGGRDYRRVSAPELLKAATAAKRRLAEGAVAPRLMVSEAAIRAEVDRQIREVLTAAQAPSPPPGQVQAAGGEDPGMMALGANLNSPFWQTPGTPGATPAGPATPTAAELATMSADEFSGHFAQAFQARAEAGGLRSPIWRDGGLLSSERH